MSLMLNLNLATMSRKRSFLDFVNIYENPSDENTLVSQIASVEVNMLEFAEAAHRSTNLPHLHKSKPIQYF